MDEVFYCGFNGFRQVPSQQDKQTITTLIAQSGKSFAAPSAEKSNKVSVTKGQIVASENSVFWIINLGS